MLPLTPLDAAYTAQIKAVVSRKMAELKDMAQGASTGRLLGHGCMDPAEASELVEQGITEIAMHVGVHYVSGTPAQALEQLVIAASNRGQSPAALIKTVLNNFLVAYITPQTQPQTEAIFDQLSALRSVVDSIRMRVEVAASA
jgi:ribosomal protein L19